MGSSKSKPKPQQYPKAAKPGSERPSVVSSTGSTKSKASSKTLQPTPQITPRATPRAPLDKPPTAKTTVPHNLQEPVKPPEPPMPIPVPPTPSPAPVQYAPQEYGFSRMPTQRYLNQQTMPHERQAAQYYSPPQRQQAIPQRPPPPLQTSNRAYLGRCDRIGSHCQSCAASGIVCCECGDLVPAAYQAFRGIKKNLPYLQLRVSVDGILRNDEMPKPQDNPLSMVVRLPITRIIQEEMDMEARIAVSGPSNQSSANTVGGARRSRKSPQAPSLVSASPRNSRRVSARTPVHSGTTYEISRQAPHAGSDHHRKSSHHTEKSHHKNERHHEGKKKNRHARHSKNHSPRSAISSSGFSSSQTSGSS